MYHLTFILAKYAQYFIDLASFRGQKKNRRRGSRRRQQSRQRRGFGLSEQGQDGARALVGDRQRLDAELLLGLQRLQVGALRREIRIDQLADAAGEGVGQRLDEVGLGLDLVGRGAEG